MNEAAVLWPDFGDVALWRDVSRNNQAVGRIGFLVFGHTRWLPKILQDAGFFPSNSEVKRNRPDLWRDAVHNEAIRVGFANIRIVLSGVASAT